MRLRIFSMIALILGIGLLSMGAFHGFHDFRELREHGGEIASMKGERDANRIELNQINLQQRGFRESLSSIPDSVRLRSLGMLSDRLKAFDKQVDTMRQKENQLTRNLRRQEQIRAGILSNLKGRDSIVGIGGLVLVAIGLMLRQGRKSKAA